MSCFFHWLIRTGWTWNTFASSATVRVCLTASRATLALKAAECRLRLPVMTHLGLDQRSSISITSRAVQLQGSTSLRSAGYPRPTQDSLPAAGQALPDGLSTRRVPMRGFGVSVTSRPPLPSLPGAIGSTEAGKDVVARFGVVGP